MGRFFSVTVHKTVITSPMALARSLWRHGEPELAQRALGLDAEQTLDVGMRAGALNESGMAERTWPDGPRYRGLLLAVVEHLDGVARPCRFDVPLPAGDLPSEFRATDKQMNKASDAVRRAADARRKAGNPVP